MFGQNAIRGRDRDFPAGDVLQVQDVWYTVQGEGPFMGQPAVFLRLTGCNLRCFFCDTKWDDDNDPHVAVRRIVDRILDARPSHCRLLVITGGEPTRWNLGPLLTELSLRRADMKVQIESNGMFWHDWMTLPLLTIVVSPKTAKINPRVWQRADAFKYVIRMGEASLTDGLPVGSTQTAGNEDIICRPRPGAEVFVSPCDEQDLTRNLANHCLVGDIALKYGYRVSLQQHKLLGVP